MARDARSGSIFFPWERRGGLRRLFGTGRLRPVVLVCSAVGFIILVGARERRQSGVRETRATLGSMRRAVDAYLAENQGSCPPQLDRVLEFSSFKQAPRDAWGNPLRLICPSRRSDERYELLSDGPDGKPGGLDRVE